jgi:hypothetical protein
MKFVHQQCERQTVPSTREPAQVTNIIRYPRDATKAVEIFMYFGKFSKSVADKIAAERMTEASLIRRGRTIVDDMPRSVIFIWSVRDNGQDISIRLMDYLGRSIKPRTIGV